MQRPKVQDGLHLSSVVKLSQFRKIFDTSLTLQSASGALQWLLTQTPPCRLDPLWGLTQPC